MSANRQPTTYSVRDLSERYDVTMRTVVAWIRSGNLRAVNVARKSGTTKPRWRVTQEALIAFEEARTPTPAPFRTSRRRRPTDVIEFYR